MKTFWPKLALFTVLIFLSTLYLRADESIKNDKADLRCEDSDEGGDLYEKGTTYGKHYWDYWDEDKIGEIKDWEDFCIDNNHLMEFTCGKLEGKPHVYRTEYFCPYSCQEGACLTREEKRDLKRSQRIRMRNNNDEEDDNIEDDEGDNNDDVDDSAGNDEIVEEPKKSPFSDKTFDTLTGKAAAYLYEKEIIEGEDGVFQGDRPVNRAEISKFLVVARFGKDFNTDYYTGNLEYQAQFSDVKKDDWFAPFVNKAAMHSIILGYPDGTFKPRNTVKKSEFLVMLQRAFELEKHLAHSYTNKLPGWVDEVAGISEKYDLFPADIVHKLDPSDELTRDDVAVAMYNFLRKN